MRNWIIYYMEFADGSPETHELDHWGKVLAPIRAERAELARKHNQAQEELRLIAGAAPEGSAKPSRIANPLAEATPMRHGVRAGTRRSAAVYSPEPADRPQP